MARSTRSFEREEFWRSVVAAQRRGGLSVREFCRQRALSEPSFYSWRRKLQQRDAQRKQHGNGENRLVPVQVVPPAGDNAPAGGSPTKNGPLEIGTPGGFSLRFDPDTSPETIAGLLEVIGRQPRPVEPAGQGGASC